MILASQGRFLGGGFLKYPRGGDLVYTQLALGFCVQALTDSYCHALAFGRHEIAFNQFDDPSNILITFFSDELYNNFQVLFIGLIFKGDFLIEDELVVGC